MTATTSTTGGMEAGPQRWAWTLLPLTLVGFVAGGVQLVSFAVQGWLMALAVGSTDPVELTLHVTVDLPSAAGTHHYLGGAFIADGSAVAATQFQAAVSGLDPLTRLLLKAGPLLWTGTVCVVLLAVALTLVRIRAQDPARSAARLMTGAAIALAAGSTLAQLVSAWADVRVSHVAWDGRNGIDGFTGLPETLFDFRPVAVAAALLVVVLLIRRTEARRPAVVGAEVP